MVLPLCLCTGLGAGLTIHRAQWAGYSPVNYLAREQSTRQDGAVSLQPDTGIDSDEIVGFVVHEIQAALYVGIIPGRTLGDAFQYEFSIHAVFMALQQNQGHKRSNCPRMTADTRARRPVT